MKSHDGLQLHSTSFRLVVLTAVCLPVLLSGCLMARGGNLPPIGEWPPPGHTMKKTIAIAVTSRMGSSRDSKPSQAQFAQLAEGQSQKAYMESKLFTHVSLAGSKEVADLRADVEVIEDGTEALAFISGFLCGFTLGLLPGYAQEDVVMVTTFRDPSGKQLASIRKSERLSFWMQLFLVAAMPFRESPDDVVRSALYDLNRSTLSEARAQGFI